ncbi:hypothetical protein AB4348_15945 [Vibrio breoganii]
MKFMLGIVIMASNLQPVLANEGDADKLGLFVSVSSECPFSQSQIVNAVEGEFLRARVKPSSNLKTNLTVHVMCLGITNTGGTKTGYGVSYEMRYGTQLSDGTNVLIEAPNFGQILIGGPTSSSTTFFVNAIRDSASHALTDYLKMIMK